MSVCKLRPESRGALEIRSNDAASAPSIRPNLLEREADVATMLDGVKLIRKRGRSPSFARPLDFSRTRSGY